MAKSKVNVIATPQVITIVSEGHTTMIREGDPIFLKVKDAVRRRDYDSIPRLLITPATVSRFSVGKLQIINSQVTYEGKPLANSIVSRIKEFIAEGLPYEPLARFLHKLQSNPSQSAIKDLYEFLEHRNLPVTQEGNFLAYKKVRDDFKDWYSNSISNHVGAKVVMKRNQVDDDSTHYCSNGLHVGSLTYATEEFHPNEGKVVIVEVNPAHAVAVPKDHSSQKLRVSEYIVTEMHKGPLLQKDQIKTKVANKDLIKRLVSYRKSKKGKAFILKALAKTVKNPQDEINKLSTKGLKKQQRDTVLFFQTK